MTDSKDINTPNTLKSMVVFISSIKLTILCKVLLYIFHIVGFCPLFMLWDSVLWDFVLWDFVRRDFVRRDFVLWDSVLWDSVPDSLFTNKRNFFVGVS